MPNIIRPQSVFQNKNSADVMKSISEIYFPENILWADLTWGKGVFWRKLPDAKVLGFDKAPRMGAIAAADSRFVPLANHAVDVAVFDPPFQHGAGGSTTLGQEADYTRMKSQTDIHELIRDTAPELKRISKLGCVIKLGDMVEGGRFMPTHLLVASALSGELGWPADIAILNSGVVRPVRHERILHWQQVHSYFFIYRWNERKPRSCLA